MARAKPGKSKFKDYVVQSILIPKSHPDVRKNGLNGARRVAQRHGDKVGKVDEAKNFYRFRQFDPGLASKKYVTMTLPGGVLIVSAPVSKKTAEIVMHRHGSGACETGTSRRRVVCADRYTSSNGKISVVARTTRKQHAKLGNLVPLGKLVHGLGRSRVSMTTKTLGAGHGRGKVISITEARGRRAMGTGRELRAVANPTRRRRPLEMRVGSIVRIYDHPNSIEGEVMEFNRETHESIIHAYSMWDPRGSSWVPVDRVYDFGGKGRVEIVRR